MFEIIKPFVGEILVLIVGGVIVYFQNRKKSDVETKKSIIDLYQESLTDLKQRYEDKFQDLKSGYDQKYDAMLKLVNDLKAEIEDWKQKYFNLKKDFDNYKKDHP